VVLIIFSVILQKQKQTRNNWRSQITTKNSAATWQIDAYATHEIKSVGRRATHHKTLSKSIRRFLTYPDDKLTNNRNKDKLKKMGKKDVKHYWKKVDAIL